MNNNDISKASKKLFVKEPFYGLFLIGLNKRYSETFVSTACVHLEGIDAALTINPSFWEWVGKDNISQVAVLKHELLHICFGHLWMDDLMPDHKLAQLATDLEINQYILPDQKGPKWEEIGVLEIQNFPEFNFPPKAGAVKYYKILEEVLKKRQQKQQQQSKSDCENQCDSSNGNSSNSNPQDQSQQSTQSQSAGGNKDYSNPYKQKHSKDKKSNDPTESKIWDYYDEPNPNLSHKSWKEFINKLNDPERKLVKNQIEHTLRKITEETQKSRGTIPSELKEIIDKLFEIEEPVIDWKAYLRRFAGNSNKIYTKKTRHKPNKRFTENPALRIKTRKHILVARDTSGSTSTQDHEEFFNELHHMYKAGVKITVVDSDAGVHDIFEYKGKPPFNLTGRGGTDFDPAIKYYNENHKKYDTLIYLTDGICPAPKIKPRTTMLWVISSGGTKDYSSDYPGKVVKIKR